MQSRVALMLFLTCLPATALPAQLRLEGVPKICPNLPTEQRPTIAVMDFEVKVGVSGEVGGGMASMLSNALLNSGCFNIAERARLDDVMNEQAFSLSGAVAEESAAASGGIRGARYHIMGEITEFSENEAAISGAARRLGRVFGRGRAVDAATNFGMRRAHIGFIIRIVNTSTGTLLSSQSFDKKRNSVGLAGAARAATALSAAGQISKAMADAIEEGIIGAVSYIAPFRSQMTDATPAVQRAQANAPTIPETCALLESAPRPPRVLVLIPEEHLLGHFGSYGDGRAFKFDEYKGDSYAAPAQGFDVNAMQASAERAIRPPDPAGETEIVKRLIEYGFLLIDERQVAALREERRFRQVHHDPRVAAQVGAELAADIVITGEAFSEFSKQINGMVSSRARVEAKAIEVSTGRIIAADGLHASTIDVSEVVAGKGALREAGGRVADYFYTQICADRALSLIAAPTAPPIAEAPHAGGTELIIRQVDLTRSFQLQKSLVEIDNVSEVETVSFKDGTMHFRVIHGGSTEQLAMALLAQAETLRVEITELEGGRILARSQ